MDKKTIMIDMDEVIVVGNFSNYLIEFLGKVDFENYFFKIDEFEEMNNIFKFKYIKLNEILEKMNSLKDIL